MGNYKNQQIGDKIARLSAAFLSNPFLNIILFSSKGLSSYFYINTKADLRRWEI